MAKNRGQRPRREPSSSGSLTGMRSGLKRMTGQAKPAKKRQQGPTFGRVFGIVLGVFLLAALTWLFTR